MASDRKEMKLDNQLKLYIYIRTQVKWLEE